jgi:hypothetical protein
MKKRTILLFVLIIVIGCGSIAILPHFLFRYVVPRLVPHDLVEETFITRAWFDLLNPGTLEARGSIFVLRGEYFLQCKSIRLRFKLRDLLRSEKPFVLFIEGMSVVADGSSEPIGNISLDRLFIEATYASPGIIELQKAQGNGDFGSFDIVGILRPQRLSLEGRLDMTGEHLQKIPLIQKIDIDTPNESYVISVQVDGLYDYPSLSVTSELFNFSMRANE